MNPSIYSLKVTSSSKRPIFAWNVPALLLGCGSTAAICGYSILFKRYSIIWAAGALVPSSMTFLYNYSQQPQQHILSVMDYIIQKRLATVDL